MSFVLNFLHKAEGAVENLGEGLARLPVQASENFNNTFANIGNRLGGGQDQTIQQNLGQGPLLDKTLSFSQATGTNRQLAGDVAQVGVAAAAPAIGKVGEAILPSAVGELGGVGGSVIRSASQGAAIGGAQGLAQASGSNQKLTPKNLTMDFLEGAGEGAALGGVGAGVVGGVKAINSVPKNEIGAVGGNVLDDETASNLAKETDEKQIQKQLQDSVGPIVAKDVAPAVSATNDPNIVHNIVNNDVGNKVSPAQEPLPSPADLPPVTPVSDVNTPEQVNEQGSAEEQSFMNSPDKATTSGASATSELGAQAGMSDILQSGGTTDEALNHHMMTTGSSIGQAQKALDEVINSKGFDKSKVNAKLNPQIEDVNFPEATEGDKDAAINSAKLANNSVVRAGRPAVQAIQQLDDHDLNLVRELRGNNPEDVISQAHDPQQFSQVVQSLKDYNDYTQASGAKLGQDIPYRQNYGLSTPYTAPEDVGIANARTPEEASYTKNRLYNTHQEALQNGEIPKYQNALEDLQADINRRAHDQSALILEKNLDKAYPGQVRKINSTDVPFGYKQLQIPGGENLLMPKDIANEINKRAPAPVASGFTKGYDTINSEFKNLKLAGGGFHSINVLGSYVGQQLASGKAFTSTGIRDLGDVIKGTFSDSSYKSTLADLNSSGKLLDADASGLVYDSEGVQGDVKGGPLSEKVPFLKQIHQSIFGRQIPLLKLKTFEQLTDGLDRNNPEDLQKMTSIAKEINQNYGGLNREIQGLTPQQFKRASRVFLSTDYNEGQLRTLTDAFSKGGAEGKLARQVVFGKALLFGGLATAGGVAGGEFQGKKPEAVAFDLLHKVVDPSFTIGGYKVGLPTTQVAEVAKPIEQTISGEQAGKGLLQGAQNFATNRLAALPAAGIELLGNQNYAGQHIYGTDSHGQPISPVNTAADVAGIGLPIPAAQVAQTASGNQSIGAAIANTVGLRATPLENSANLPVAQQTYLGQLKDAGKDKTMIDSSADFFSALKQEAKSRASTSDEIDRDLAKGDVQDAQKAADTYNQELIKVLKPVVQKNPSILTDQLVGQLQSSIIDLSDTSISSRLQSILSNPRKYGIKTPALT